jgi:2-polyprenyl-3-methyl-5-hydroxy-6-metoxy-1,4-benzoquinol methylase
MRSSRRTSEFFDSYAHDFSAIYGTSNTIFSRLINRLFRKSMMLRYVKTIEGCDPIEGKTVLDVGCGPGHYGIALALKGARRIVGIDFAPGMIRLAEQNAASAGAEDRCSYVCGDFMEYDAADVFDYSILMGFMDYMEDPRRVIEKAVALTSSRAFFSFPADGGFLAWQRKLRYRRKCDLYLYTYGHLKELFRSLPETRTSIEKIERDFFVTVVVGES